MPTHVVTRVRPAARVAWSIVWFDKNERSRRQGRHSRTISSLRTIISNVSYFDRPMSRRRLRRGIFAKRPRGPTSPRSNATNLRLINLSKWCGKTFLIAQRATRDELRGELLHRYRHRHRCWLLVVMLGDFCGAHRVELESANFEVCMQRFASTARRSSSLLIAIALKTLGKPVHSLCHRRRKTRNQGLYPHHHSRQSWKCPTGHRVPC